MFLTGVALETYEAYFENPQDIWDLYIKGLPFTKNNLPFTKNILPFTKTYYHLQKTYYQVVINIKQHHTF